MSSRLWRVFASAAPIGLLGCSLLVDTSGLSNGSNANEAGTQADGAGADGTSPVDGGALLDAEGGGPAPSNVLLSAGGLSTCAARAQSIWCWGDNTSGQLGDGTRTKRLAPVAVLALPGGNVTGLGVGETHACAVIGGNAYCWGSGTVGQLGSGPKADSSTPVMVASLPAGKVTQVSAGTDFSCGVAAGTAYCWGTNGSGQLGNPIGASAAIPVSVATAANGALTGVEEVASGQDHACARLTNGDVFCWGHNDNGTLGSSMLASGAVAPTALKVEGLPGPAQKVSIAGWHACAIIGGAVWCWGTGTAGELGNGGTADSTTPVAAAGLGSSVTTLATGGGPTDRDATCAVRAGEALCWGNDQSGRLGDGQTSPRGVAFAVASLPTNVVSVAAGFDHACALLGMSDVRCWGRGTNGQLGDGAGVDRSAAVVVALPP